MYEIQYRCIYREQWYYANEADNQQLAIHLASLLQAETGRKVRVVDPAGLIVWPRQQ